MKYLAVVATTYTAEVEVEADDDVAASKLAIGMAGRLLNRDMKMQIASLKRIEQCIDACDEACYTETNPTQGEDTSNG